MARGCGSATDALEVERARRRIDGDEVADRPAERGVVRACLLVGRVVDLAPAEVVVLPREGVAPDLLAVLRLADRADRFEQADRVVLVDELLGRQLHQPVELPPHRLVLAAMPAEELGQQPARLLRRRALERIDRHDGRVRETVHERLHPGLVL